MSDKIKDEIAGHWAENEIKYLYEKYMVNGDDNGSLCLKDNITRAELSALIVRALDLSLDTTEAEFSDISGEDWYTSAVATAAKAGIVHGYEDNSFRPNNFVTRGELATILANVARSKDLTADDRETNYVDLENSWSAENAIYVSKLGLMNGMGNNYFSPENYTLREEVMAVVYRLLSRLGQV